jgi:hypothetical protein
MALDPSSLVDYFATEIGIRQAWPFITFAASIESQTPQEIRLYIDSTSEVTPPAAFVLEADPDDPAAALPALLKILNLTVVGVQVDANADLAITFDGGIVLLVSGTPASWTTHDVWWLGSPCA